jgi:hypothetical protein
VARRLRVSHNECPFYEVAIEAIETGAERITDEAIERYKPVGEGEAAYQ